MSADVALIVDEEFDIQGDSPPANGDIGAEAHAIELLIFYGDAPHTAAEAWGALLLLGQRDGDEKQEDRQAAKEESAQMSREEGRSFHDLPYCPFTSGTDCASAGQNNLEPLKGPFWMLSPFSFWTR